LGLLNYYQNPQKALDAFSDILKADSHNPDVLNLAGAMHRVLGNIREARKHYLFAMKYAKRSNNRAQLMIANLSLGRLYESLDNYVKAFGYRMRIWKRALNWGAEYPIAIAGYEYGETCVRVDFLEQAKIAIEMAFGAAKKLENQELITRGYCLLSMLERSEGNFEYAFKLSKSAVWRYADIHQDEYGHHHEMINAGALLRDLNRFHESELILLEAEKWFLKHGDQKSLPQLFVQLGETKLVLGYKGAALEYLRKSHKLFVETGSILKANYVNQKIQDALSQRLN